MFTTRFIFSLFISICAILVTNTRIYAGNTQPDSLLYFGHSFVEIKTSEGINIYIDPTNVNEFRDSADIVLITHEHTDHNEINRVKQKSTCRVIRSADAIKSGVYQSFTIGNVKISAVAAYNSYHQKSSCVGYVVEFDGIKLYHSGDTDKINEMADLTALNIDYALLCMDGVYTMSPEQATQAAAIINAKHDIPIHTMPPTDTYSDAIVARFTSPNKLIVKPGKVIELVGQATDVKKGSVVPDGYKLEQNYPNPFNPETIINYSIPENARVGLKIYDMLGHEISALVNKVQNAGIYEVKFSPFNLPSGVYIYKLSAVSKTNSFNYTRKMVFLK